jgi:hypothetical protein
MGRDSSLIDQVIERARSDLEFGLGFGNRYQVWGPKGAQGPKFIR